MSEIARVGIVGAGFMGSGIAESCARAGVHVTLHEPEAAPLERSRARIEDSLGRAAARGKLTEQEAAAALGRIAWSSDLSAFEAVDAVIEAVVEDARVKGRLFQELDALLPDASFLASNTSSIPIAEIASWTRRPDRVLTLEFVLPVAAVP